MHHQRDVLRVLHFRAPLGEGSGHAHKVAGQARLPLDESGVLLTRGYYHVEVGDIGVVQSANRIGDTRRGVYVHEPRFP